MDDVVAYMPIRLNSKRTPLKSVKQLGGRPLLCWSLEQLDALGFPVYVYCSEPAAVQCHVDFKPTNVQFIRRSKELDADSVIGIDIYREFNRAVPAKTYLLAHCTSPFVSTDTYNRVVNAVVSEGYDSSCTAYEVKTFCWYADKPINFVTPRPRTQDLLPVCVETSAAYCYRAEVLERGARSGEKHKLISTDRRESLDIDYPEDFDEAERLVQ